MILALDPGVGALGWAVIQPPRCTVRSLGVVIQGHDATLDDTTCRARRGLHQARELYAIISEHHIRMIAAEAVSTGGPGRFAMAQSLNFSWGVITALAAIAGCELREVRPKVWQHAIVPDANGRKIDYRTVFSRLSGFIRDAHVLSQLIAIPRRHRNHALDAVGVGLYAALRGDYQHIALSPS